MSNTNMDEYRNLVKLAHVLTVQEAVSRREKYEISVEKADTNRELSQAFYDFHANNFSSSLSTWTTLSEQTTISEGASSVTDSESTQTEFELAFEAHFEELFDERAPIPASPPSPPSLHWVELLTSAEAGPDFVQNMEELYYDRWLPKYGAKKARAIVISQGVQFIGRQWISPILKLFDRLKAFSVG